MRFPKNYFLSDKFHSGGGAELRAARPRGRGRDAARCGGRPLRLAWNTLEPAGKYLSKNVIINHFPSKFP